MLIMRLVEKFLANVVANSQPKVSDFKERKLCKPSYFKEVLNKVSTLRQSLIHKQLTYNFSTSKRNEFVTIHFLSKNRLQMETIFVV